MNSLSRIRNLTRQRRYSEALAGAQTLSAEQPNDRDTLYLLAVNQRCLDRIPDALKTLDQLEREHPDLSRLYQERGFCFLSLRDSARAIAALENAVRRNPALTASWGALETLYRMIGDSANAAAAGEQIANLKRLPAQVVQAGSHFSEGDFGTAETLVRAHLAKEGNDVEALRLLARIEQQRDALDAAERLLEALLKIAPDYRVARLELAQVLIGRQKYLQARAQLQALLELEPDNSEYRTLCATACAGSGDHESAIAYYRAILAKDQRLAHVQLLLGHSLKATGRQIDAIESYHAARNARPDFGDAYWSLANLKTYRFSDPDIMRMQNALSAPATLPIDRLHLHFALGKALEIRGRYQESWQNYESGNALKHEQSRYRPEFSEIGTQRQIEVCTPAFFAEHAKAGAPDPDPIFIVGLPRSGSTLIEQILASHSQVAGTQELHDIPRIVQELQGRSDPSDPDYPAVLRDLAFEDFRKLGERYLADTRAYRTAKPGAPLFIDKMPNNFRHVGLIRLMLPNAKIIDARRGPMACCWGNFKQLYAGGHEFSYDLESMARYYRAYLRLMQHWEQVLPGRVHRVIYEDLIEDLEGTVRQLLDFCSLQFEPACLDFHKTARNISTASSEQVRRPINRDGLREWTHYRPWLHPLEDALGDAVVRYRD
ncbi:MAG TPA: sulfotransferase [Steroidobacteraceae bacterium]